MGYLAQESSVFRKLTVEQNLLGVMELLGIDRADAPPPLRRAARAVRDHAHPQEQGRLALRRRTAAAGDRPLPGFSDPEIILLDEPFTGIDPVTIESIQEIIRDLQDPRHLDPDHRPPGARNAGDHRSQLHHREGLGRRAGPEGCGSRASRGPRALFRRRQRTPRRYPSPTTSCRPRTAESHAATAEAGDSPQFDPRRRNPRSRRLRPVGRSRASSCLLTKHGFVPRCELLRPRPHLRLLGTDEIGGQHADRDRVVAGVEVDPLLGG